MRNLGNKRAGVDAGVIVYSLGSAYPTLKDSLRWAVIDLADHYRVSEKALALYHEILALLPDDPLLLDRLGWAYALSGSRDRAVAVGYFQRAAELYYDGNEQETQVELSLPFSGRWRMVQGNDADFYHVGLGRFARDFARLGDDNRTFKRLAGEALRNEDFHSFGTAVLGKRRRRGPETAASGPRR